MKNNNRKAICTIVIKYKKDNIKKLTCTSTLFTAPTSSVVDELCLMELKGTMCLMGVLLANAIKSCKGSLLSSKPIYFGGAERSLSFVCFFGKNALIFTYASCKCFST